ncbi:MAG TPA: nucleotide sugar dehydrogenase, partial [Coxiellaceae bacterium]|nr:nucleotide sugar dehydrogenase [Coxiellaceae bacterium]
IQIEFDVVSNPEFLREGMAVRDFMQPDRIIIGSDSSKALETIRSLYRSFVRDEDNIVLMSAKDAELCKYASNAFLATKISFMNEISNLCELLGADIHNVYHGLSKDSRISPAFLQAGCGYGGSCFPKDVKALIHMAHQHQFSSDILKAVEHRNHLQKRLLFQKLADTLGMPVEGKTIALWGLSFKPGTDDLRESPALTFLELALQAGLKIKAYDPVAMSAAKQQLPATWFEEGRLTLVTSAEEALHGAEALVLVTDWDEFKRFDSQKIAHRLSQRVVIDGRNVLDQQALENLGCRYIGFGAVSKIIPEICGV